MKRSSVGLLALAVAGVVGTQAYAAQYLGWADRFTQATVTCRSYGTSNIACAMSPLWNGSGTWSPPTWSYVGAQGANAGGRAAAQEEVMFQFRDAHAGSYTATVTLSRYRTTTPPAESAACTGGTFVTSVQQTLTSTAFSGADFYANNRVLPVLNFSSETATAGTTIGYRSIVESSSDAGGAPALFSISGCQKIAWN